MLRKVELLGAEVVCDFLKDSWIFDTNNIPAATNLMQYYQTKAGKTDDLQNFHADGAIVQKDRILETLAIVAKVYGINVIDYFDTKALFEVGTLRLDIDEDKEDADNLLRWAGGIYIRSDVEPANIGFLDRSYMGDGRHDNVRVYAKHKMMPGGKAVDVTLRWPQAGGSGNALARQLQVACYGYELKPRAKVASAS
jgi:hypothetical protein